MNETIKVLTIISTIFMPLSFIAGVYGMNFEADESILNMPELRWKYGYPFALGLMGIVAVVQLWFFHRRGWIGRSKQRERELKEEK
jgi:magnesium transporter